MKKIQGKKLEAIYSVMDMIKNLQNFSVRGLR